MALGHLLLASSKFLSDSVLPMGIHSTVRNGLAASTNVCHPHVVHETSVVGMIVFDRGPVGSCEVFEGNFRFECLCTGVGTLEMNVAEAAVMVHEDRCILVPLGGKCSLELANETG